MRMEFNIVIEGEAFKNMNSYSMKVNIIVNDKEFVFIKAIPREAEPDYFDYVWDDIGKHVRKEYIKALK